MQITKLAVESLRVIDKARLELQPGLNIIVGANGSGKSSLLESLYLAARGRSPRSRNSRPVIKDGKGFLRVVLELEDQAGLSHRLGLEKGRKETKARLDGKDLQRISELTRALPVVLVNPESIEWVSGSPDVRRQFYDYLVFHVEHNHLPALQRFNTLLRQRNAALAKKQSRNLILTWDGELSKVAAVIEHNRQRLFQEFQIAMVDWWQRRWPEESIGLKYFPGYEQDGSLEEQLSENLEKDIKRGFTQRGPHRFDLKLSFGDSPAKDSMSRGQQRYAAISAMVAGSRLLSNHSGRLPVVMIDDLTAELDEATQALVVNGFLELVDQVIVTGTQKSSFLAYLDLTPKLFHVEHGTFTEVDSKFLKGV